MTYQTLLRDKNGTSLAPLFRILPIQGIGSLGTLNTLLGDRNEWLSLAFALNVQSGFSSARDAMLIKRRHSFIQR